MYFKKLVGKKCYLSPMDVNDGEKIAEWFNDLEVTVNLTLYSDATTVDAGKGFVNNFSKNHTYSIIDINTDEMIGECGFMCIDNLNQTAELGIVVGNKKYWNKGYGSEALKLLLDYGFKALNLHNVLLDVYSFNKNAKRCYEKIGFKEIGKRREALYRDLKNYDIIFMDILANEFYEKK